MKTRKLRSSAPTEEKFGAFAFCECTELFYQISV